MDSTQHPMPTTQPVDAPTPTQLAAAPTQLAAAPGQLARGELRKATSADLGALTRALADAFYDDPVFSWLLPDERSRRARLRRFYAIELRHVGFGRGRVWTCAEVAGAAITTPPGAWRMPTYAVLMQGPVFGRRLARATRLLGAMEWRHPRGPHYYVAHIGVSPPMQGMGLGSRLLRPTLERCDRERLPAYLEASSERSAALYERLGFRHIRELRVGGSPPLWLMSREPQPEQPVAAEGR
jgi:ribosomal protein S18 acetylase RimI-like enzyme